jgi:hypothetical protein
VQDARRLCWIGIKGDRVQVIGSVVLDARAGQQEGRPEIAGVDHRGVTDDREREPRHRGLGRLHAR